MPQVFAEQGVSMLSAILHSDTTIDASVRIMGSFTEMRHLSRRHPEATTRLRQSYDVIPMPAHKTDWDQWRKTRAIQAARHLWKGL